MMNTRNSSQTLLSVEDLRIDFVIENIRQNSTITVAKYINFNICQGETFCLVGESGSGKSVCALSIMRLLPQNAKTNGNIYLHGDGYTQEKLDLLSCDEKTIRQVRGGKIAMIFQEPMTSLNPVLTIGAQIVEAIVEHQPQISFENATLQAVEALSKVQIKNPEQRFTDYPHQLSGGQRQRVMIAMALVCEPELLIADEPTTALDVTIQAEILQLMQELQKDSKMSILFITHDFGVVAQMANTVGVMCNGRLVEVGKTMDVLRSPKHAYTKKLLNSVPENLSKVNVSVKNNLKNDLHKKDEYKNILEINKLKIWFPIKQGLFKRTVGHIKAVDDVSMSIKANDIVALVGESGSGKSTLGRGIVALEKARAGEVLFEGVDINSLNSKELRKARAHLQMVFQDPLSSLNPRLSIAETLTEPLKVHGIGNAYDERIELAAQILKDVQLERDSLWRYPHAFSGGQRQRISLARALGLNPRIIVCDEITSALDVSVQAEILFLLQEIRAARNLSLLFITHNLAVVEYLCDSSVIMKDGKIIEIGKTADVCNNPQHPYTQKLIAAVPRINL